MIFFGIDRFDDLEVGLMNEMSLFQERLLGPRTHSGSPEGEGRDWSSVFDEHRPL